MYRRGETQTSIRAPTPAAKRPFTRTDLDSALFPVHVHCRRCGNRCKPKGGTASLLLPPGAPWDRTHSLPRTRMCMRPAAYSYHSGPTTWLTAASEYTKTRSVLPSERQRASLVCAACGPPPSGRKVPQMCEESCRPHGFRLRARRCGTDDRDGRMCVLLWGGTPASVAKMLRAPSATARSDC